MAAAKVRTPVEKYNGTVAGVEFVDGVGETDDPNALAYFDRHGYTVETPKRAAARKPAAKPSE
ncbi:hypothetical protein [Gordonia insulae]|uniref:Uncharacterized protein n=1 Tax=Gordonia insulae TaxID=2420509 RepID=A0A3G8JGS1_9ACTN|nr:hypothetical protein [Gordonia insulae]AZG43450.1 hypothetical protein D7316_00014 [Gordonia insulae]